MTRLEREDLNTLLTGMDATLESLRQSWRQTPAHRPAYEQMAKLLKGQRAYLGLIIK